MAALSRRPPGRGEAAAAGRSGLHFVEDLAVGDGRGVLDGDADELFDIMVDIYANPVKNKLSLG